VPNFYGIYIKWFQKLTIIYNWPSGINCLKAVVREHKKNVFSCNLWQEWEVGRVGSVEPTTLGNLWHPLSTAAAKTN
jgi:hypothetical protein